MPSFPIPMSGGVVFNSGTGQIMGPGGNVIGTSTPGLSGAGLWQTVAAMNSMYGPGGMFALGANGQQAGAGGSGTGTDGGTAAAGDGGSAEAIIRSALQTYGLDQPSLIQWAHQMILDHRSNDEILLQLRERPEYKARFPGMEIRKQNGLAPISEADYIDYEHTWKALAVAYNLPKGFYDGPEDVADLLGKDYSPAEIQWRIEQGYNQVAAAPAAVRQTFKEWYGPDGDSALAAFFLDDEKARPILERYVGTGSIGGTARAIGIQLSQAKAGQLYDIAQTAQSAQPRLASLFAKSPLFDETVTESQDFKLEEQGVDAAFGLGPDAEQLLNRRLDERTATTRGGGGAAVGSKATGFGAARDQ